VEKMTITKLHIQLTALLFSLVYPSAVLTGQIVENENKNNRTGNAFSNVDLADDAGSNFKFAVENQQSDARRFQQMEELWQRRQLEDFKQHLLDRNYQLNTDQSVPVDVQSRRNEYIKRMQQRREFFNKMNDQRRQEAEERKELMRQKIHRTSTNPPVPAYT
jgi:small-conductance mechanosensitive channel